MRVRRFLAVVCLVLSLVGCATKKVPATEGWSSAITQVSSGVVRVTYGEGRDEFCSGTLIDEARDYVLTAEHCFIAGVTLYVNGLVGKLIMSDATNDFAILHVPGVSGTTLHPRPTAPLNGMAVAMLGHPFRANRPKATFGHVSDVDDPSVMAGVILVDGTVIRGQSGGPVVDAAGRLVGIVRGSLVTMANPNDPLQIIVPIDTILASPAADYFARK